MFADIDPFLKVNSLPYSEYWLPLIIGVGIGFMFLAAAKSLTAKRPHGLPPPPSKHSEYDPFVQGSPTEQRASFRRTGSPVEVHYAMVDNKKQSQLGWVFDRSVGGLGLVTAEVHTPGTVLAVRPVRTGEASPWVEVEVRSCRPGENGDFEVGCKFVRTPPWSVLLSFG